MQQSKTEFIVPHGDTKVIPIRPAEFLAHFERLFELIPHTATNPRIHFHEYPGMYSLQYDRLVTPEEEAESLRKAQALNNLATAELIKEEKAELARLLEKYGE